MDLLDRYGVYIIPCLIIVLGRYIAAELSRRATVSKRAKAATERNKAGQATIDAMSGALAGSDPMDAALETLGSLPVPQLDAPVLETLGSLQTGALSSKEVLRATLRRSIELTGRTNCITEFPKTLAELEAEADESASLMLKNGPGILQGLPVSIKECIAWAGNDVTIGTAARIGKLYDEDAVLMQVLRHQGAIPFARTNIPQTMLSYECSNTVFGITTNPHNPAKGPGGSSGGEGCLIGGGASLLGIGTDIGGSSRIPAAFSGCTGFKPTSKRISKKGCVSSTPGQEGIAGSVGPMAREVDGLALLMRALWADGVMNKLDPTVLPFPFDEAAYGHPIKAKVEQSGGNVPAKPGGMVIGWFDDDGFATPTASCQRAVREARDALTKQGHTLVEFDVKGMGVGVDSIELFAMLIGADEGETLLKNIKNEATDEILKDLVFLISVPKFVRRLVSWLYAFKGEPRIARLVGGSGKKTTHELWALQARRSALQTKVFEAMREQKLDALLCPSGVFAAPSSGAAAGLSAMCCYTAMWNVLDAPAGVVPVTKVTEEDEAALRSYPLRDKWDREIVKAAKDGVGLPVAVQLVAPPWKDEVCLRAMKEVELAVQYKA